MCYFGFHFDWNSNDISVLELSFFGAARFCHQINDRKQMNKLLHKFDSTYTDKNLIQQTQVVLKLDLSSWDWEEISGKNKFTFWKIVNSIYFVNKAFERFESASKSNDTEIEIVFLRFVFLSL